MENAPRRAAPGSSKRSSLRGPPSLPRATAVASYILAYLDKQTASDVTTTIFTACIGYLVSYAAASTTEKVSRNRHGLDADGNPFQTNNTEGGSDTSGPTLG